MSQTDLQYRKKKIFRKKIIQVGLVIVKGILVYKENLVMGKKNFKPLNKIKLKILNSSTKSKKWKKREKVETG